MLESNGLRLLQLTVESNGLTLLQLGGSLVLGLLILRAAWSGWRKGAWAWVWITLGTIITYVLFIDGGAQLWGYINNIYTNVPRIAALLTGGNPTTAPVWEPIPLGFTLPLILRLGLFAGGIVIAILLNRPTWRGSPRGDVRSQVLGAFAGGLTASLWVNGLATLWREAGGNIGFAPVDAIMGLFPDISGWMPIFMVVFIVWLLAAVLIRFPLLLRP